MKPQIALVVLVCMTTTALLVFSALLLSRRDTTALCTIVILDSAANAPLVRTGRRYIDGDTLICKLK